MASNLLGTLNVAEPECLLREFDRQVSTSYMNKVGSLLTSHYTLKRWIIDWFPALNPWNALCAYAQKSFAFVKSCSAPFSLFKISDA